MFIKGIKCKNESILFSIFIKVRLRQQKIEREYRKKMFPRKINTAIYKYRNPKSIHSKKKNIYRKLQVVRLHIQEMKKKKLRRMKKNNKKKNLTLPSKKKKIVEKPIRIIQLSPRCTGSTVLVNMLYGYLQPEKPVVFGFVHDLQKLKRNQIIKTHDLNIDQWMRLYGKVYKLYFVCSNRGILHIDPKYHSYKNVLVFDYPELLETPENTLDLIIENGYQKLSIFLPAHLSEHLNQESALLRIQQMNERYKEIKNKSFTNYVDDFYQLHGHHRNRFKKVKREMKFKRR